MAEWGMKARNSPVWVPEPKQRLLGRVRVRQWRKTSLFQQLLQRLHILPGCGHQFISDEEALVSTFRRDGAWPACDACIRREQEEE